MEVQTNLSSTIYLSKTLGIKVLVVKEEADYVYIEWEEVQNVQDPSRCLSQAALSCGLRASNMTTRACLTSEHWKCWGWFAIGIRQLQCDCGCHRRKS